MQGMLSPISRALPLTLAMALMACGPPHVELTAAPRSAPPAARLQSYEELRPRSKIEAETGVRTEIPAGVLRTSSSLKLGNGVEVKRADDLAQVVPSNSDAGKAAREVDRRETIADWLVAGGVALAASGVVIAVSPFIVPSDDQSIDTTPVYLGTGLAVLSLPLFLLNITQRQAATEAKATAFERYEPALRERLGICDSPQKPVPCR